MSRSTAKPSTGVKPGEYLPIERQWAAGDVIRLRMEMPPQVLEANPRVADDTGRVALQRGPLVYCMEGIDQPNGVELADVALRSRTEPDVAVQSDYMKDMLGGMVVLRHKGVAISGRISSRPLFAIQRPTAKDPANPVDLYSVLRVGKPAGDSDASVDASLEA